MSERNQQTKKINVDQVVTYLNRAFSVATKKAAPVIGEKNHRGTELHKHQVDFAHMINDIQRGPRYIVPKVVTEANDLIDRLNKMGESEGSTDNV